MPTSRFLFFLFAFMAISIGLYPFTAYLFIHEKFGLLAGKSPLITQNIIWHSAFYLHIFFGGIALLTGWSQFSKKLREKFLSRHRMLGKIYVSSVIISGIAGLYIACYSDGGMITHLGFGLLAILWLLFTVLAYTNIRKMNISGHERFMIRSYSLCFAAVTLRLLIPAFTFGMHMSFISAYRIISWLCWVPNLFFAEWIISSGMKKVRPLESKPKTNAMVNDTI